MGLFDFGKKRRMSKRSKVHHKPPARLLSICKKYRVKATTKSGGKRVYKKVSVLKKLCLKKAMAHRKKLIALKKKQMMKRSRRGSKKMPKRRRRGSKKVSRRRRRVMRRGGLDSSEFGLRRRSGFGEYTGMGEEEEMTGVPAFGLRRRYGFGENTGMDQELDHSYFGAHHPATKLEAHQCYGKLPHIPKQKCHGNGMVWKFGESCSKRRSDNDFGKRRRVARAKGSKMAAMKAFRSFYKRHCAGARRRSGFGSGNPPLYQSMGYEFCPNGQGGVLGSNSTGLFPSPCTSVSSSAKAKMPAKRPAYSSSAPVKMPAKIPAKPKAKFGAHRPRHARPMRRRRSSAAGGPMRRRRRSGFGEDDDMDEEMLHAFGLRRRRRSTM